VSSIQSCTTCDESTIDSSIAGDVHDIDVGESTQGERVIEHESFEIVFYNDPNDYDNVFIEAFTESFVAKTTPFFCPESDDEGNCVAEPTSNDHQIVKSCPGLTLDPGVVEHIVSSSPTKLVKLTTDTINQNTNGSTNVDCNTIQVLMYLLQTTVSLVCGRSPVVHKPMHSDLFRPSSILSLPVAMLSQAKEEPPIWSARMKRSFIVFMVRARP
jgi:hypothetical protein